MLVALPELVVLMVVLVAVLPVVLPVVMPVLVAVLVVQGQERVLQRQYSALLN